MVLDNRSFAVRRTSRSKLREVDQFGGHELRGREQNPETGWAQLAPQGKKIMQFIEQRRYGQEARDQQEQNA